MFLASLIEILWSPFFVLAPVYIIDPMLASVMPVPASLFCVDSSRLPYQSVTDDIVLFTTFLALDMKSFAI
jgi:hypothetical protein